MTHHPGSATDIALGDGSIRMCVGVGDGCLHIIEGQVERYIKSLRGRGVIRGDERTSWLVYDFTTGKKLVSINENSSLQAASMIKPYLALAFFHQVKAGKLVYGPKSKRHMTIVKPFGVSQRPFRT